MAKKATKAELIQEWTETDKGWVPILSSQYTQEDHLHAYRSKNSGLLYRPAPSGCLEPWADGSLPLQAGAHVQFVQARGHVLAYKVDIRSNAKLRGPRDPLEEESTLTLLWDSEGQLPCPLPIEVDGRCVYGELLPQWDGGLLVYLYGVRYGAFNSMIRDLIRHPCLLPQWGLAGAADQDGRPGGAGVRLAGPGGGGEGPGFLCGFLP